MQIGYARVSTFDQDLSLQRDALEAAGCERIFADTISGAKANRPQLTAALDHLRPGDTLTVWRLDRLGRSLSELIDLMTQLNKEGIAFRSLTEADRHDDLGRQAHLPHLRSAGRVRTRTDPGADSGGTGRGTGPRTEGWPAETAGRAR